jgi:hypothetical protein
VQSELPMHLSPRCGAWTRRGTPCRAPAMPNGRCRMHGGTSPGAPRGNANAFKHGRYTAEAITRRREITVLIRGMRQVIERVIYGKSITEMAQALLPELVPVLAEIARDKDAPAAARVTAINTLWDRAEGKPKQSIEHGGKDGGPIVHVMTEEGRALLMEALPRITAVIAGNGRGNGTTH